MYSHSPLVGMDISQALTAMNLGQYAPRFEMEGYDDLDLLSSLDVAELESVADTVQMKPGHKMKFVKSVVSNAGRSGFSKEPTGPPRPAAIRGGSFMSSRRFCGCLEQVEGLFGRDHGGARACLQTKNVSCSPLMQTFTRCASLPGRSQHSRDAGTLARAPLNTAQSTGALAAHIPDVDQLGLIQTQLPVRSEGTSPADIMPPLSSSISRDTSLMNGKSSDSQLGVSTPWMPQPCQSEMRTHFVPMPGSNACEDVRLPTLLGAGVINRSGQDVSHAIGSAGVKTPVTSKPGTTLESQASVEDRGEWALRVSRISRALAVEASNRIGNWAFETSQSAGQWALRTSSVLGKEAASAIRVSARNADAALLDLLEKAEACILREDSSSTDETDMHSAISPATSAVDSSRREIGLPKQCGSLLAFQSAQHQALPLPVNQCQFVRSCTQQGQILYFLPLSAPRVQAVPALCRGKADVDAAHMHRPSHFLQPVPTCGAHSQVAFCPAICRRFTA